MAAGSTAGIWRCDTLTAAIELRDPEEGHHRLRRGGTSAPSEVEQAVVSHPAVLEAAVIAVPDEKWGEVPKAFVTLAEGKQASAEEIMRHCKTVLAHFKAPRQVEFRSAAEDVHRQGAKVRVARPRVARQSKRIH